MTTIDKTESRIARAVAHKCSQVRDSNAPVLLAINASGIVSKLESFDCALFGHGVQVIDRFGQTTGHRFELDGAFTRFRNPTKPPTYAGVLAFVQVGLLRVPDPVLYLHPSFSGDLPDSVFDLERRHVGRDPAGVRVTAARRRHVASTLGIESK